MMKHEMNRVTDLLVRDNSLVLSHLSKGIHIECAYGGREVGKRETALFVVTKIGQT